MISKRWNFFSIRFQGLEAIRRIFPIIGIAFIAASHATAAVWQWSVLVPPLFDRTNETPRAFLWIPTDCARIRGVVFAHHNMEEESVLEHSVFRKALAELGFAEVWVAPTFDMNFSYDKGAGEKFEAMMSDLAKASGYAELARVPVLPVGHSAAASVPWIFATWKPERTIASISFSGQWPYVWFGPQSNTVAGRSCDAVPGIVTMGEYEAADDVMTRGLKIRADHPSMPLSGLGCPADGHFAAMDEKVTFLALYVRKAAQFRLPKTPSSDGTARLTPIDVTKDGWLVDRYGTDRNPMAPAAPVGEYKGDRTQAFWYFDGEIAQAAEVFQQRQRGQATLLGYVQGVQVVTQRNGTHQQVTLKFMPEEDGTTFHLEGAFLDTVPEGRPEKWTRKKAGERIERPEGGPPIEIRRITGPVRWVTNSTWTLAFNRASFLGDRRGNDAWFAAVWPGFGPFKRAVQQAQMPIPRRNGDGKPQKIDFAPIGPQRYGTASVTLKATSDSGLPVRFFVREGPAELDGDVLRMTKVPPRAQFPIKVTVVAWQWGRSIGDKVQSAEPVIQTFELVR